MFCASSFWRTQASTCARLPIQTSAEQIIMPSPDDYLIILRSENGCALGLRFPPSLLGGMRWFLSFAILLRTSFGSAFQIYVALNFMSPPEIKCLISSVKSAVICSMLYLLFMASQRAIIPLSSTCAVAELLWRIPGQLTFCLFVVNVPNLLN